MGSSTSAEPGTAQKLEFSEWFHVPFWERAAPLQGRQPLVDRRAILVFGDVNTSLYVNLSARLEAEGCLVIGVDRGLSLPPVQITGF